MRHHAVDAHCTQDEGQTSQEREQQDDLARWTDGRVEHAAHRRRLLHRGGGSHACDCAPHRFEERRLGGTGRGAEDDRLCVVYPGHLRQRDIPYWLGRVGQTFFSGVRHDPDDARTSLVNVAADRPADGIDSREVPLGKCLVDDDDTFGFGPVVAD